MMKNNGQDIKNCVYIGYDQNGLFKIGMSNNWQRRQKEIQNMNPNFNILTIIPNDKPAVLEATLHTAFDKKRVVGEWFYLSAEDIKYILDNFSDYDAPFDSIYLAWKDAVGSNRYEGLENYL